VTRARGVAVINHSGGQSARTDAAGSLDADLAVFHGLSRLGAAVFELLNQAEPTCHVAGHPDADDEGMFTLGFQGKEMVEGRHA